jgi:hypothetical protein
MRVLLLLVVLVIEPYLLAQSQGACRLTVLPSEVQVLLATKFPGWRPKRVADLGTDDKRLWLEARPNSCPGIAVGHFEQADSLAYAMLLVLRSRHTASFKLVIFSRVSDRYAVRVLDHAENNTETAYDSGQVISKMPPGTYTDFGETQKVRLKLDGLNVEWLEKASVLYYWSHGSYRSIQTSD